MIRLALAATLCLALCTTPALAQPLEHGLDCRTDLLSTEGVLEFFLETLVREIDVAHRGRDVGVANSNSPTRSTCAERLG